MASRQDIMQAVMVLKDLSDTEIEWLTELAQNPASIHPNQVMSHAAAIKVLIQSQTALNFLLTNQMNHIDDQIQAILDKMDEKKK